MIVTKMSNSYEGLDAHDMGKAMWEDGLPITSNPFHVYDPQFKYWEDGWYMMDNMGY